MKLNEQQILQDAIVAYKFLIHMYCQFGLECSNQTLRNLFNDLHDIASKHNFKIFKIMNEKEFYPTTVSPSKEIKQTLKMHTQMQQELEEILKEK